MASSRSTFTLDTELAERARQLGINISSAARQGVADAVRAALARSDREAYRKHPEGADFFWTEAESWGEEGGAASSGWLRSAARGARCWSWHGRRASTSARSSPAPRSRSRF